MLEDYLRKFARLSKITPEGAEVSLGDMYVGTIHGFCLAKLREFWADDYHNYDVLDESARAALILRGYSNLLGLRALQDASGQGQYATLDSFILAYDQLHEHDRFEVELAPGRAPIRLGEAEQQWCKAARLLTDVGDTGEARAFAVSAARYYAYLHCRRFLDFSSSQTEFIRNLRRDPHIKAAIESAGIHLVVDEIQDINPVQRSLIELLSGPGGKFTAVGDHRQSIYGFRGAKVEIIAELWEKLKKSKDAEVIDLQENFRSTKRLIELANRWAGTISPLRSMRTPPMKHGNKRRHDKHFSHMSLISFSERAEEAEWIAQAIKVLVPSEHEGARHDKKDGGLRGLCQYGAEEGRAEEQPLMVKPEAVTVSTIHSVKGLEFAAVFLADAKARRFPSSYAKRKPNLPLSGRIEEEIDLAGLSDNDNYDGERRLMYVAITRAERFLMISYSGREVSRFIKELRPMVLEAGGLVTDDSERILKELEYAPKEYRRELQLCTSFSDLRYYIECPHDFYLRKVLGFAPTIDQAFGYGKGVHNLLRAVHTEPAKWAAVAGDRVKLEAALGILIDRGLFYLRYTTGVLSSSYEYTCYCIKTPHAATALAVGEC